VVTSTADEPLLSPGFLARLEQLQLATRRPLGGRFTGEHRSSRYGTSLDFADYRPYHPGDDFRRIDYQLWARLDVLLLRLFEAEDDLTLRVLFDTSASMGFGGKLRQAQRAIAALGFVALVRRDAVEVHTFPFERQAPRFVGRGAAPRLFAHLAAQRAEGETRFAEAAAHLLGRAGPRGVTVVVSDLLTPEWSQALARLPARGGELVVVHVLDQSELHPTLLGDLELVDRETGATVAVSLSAAALRDYERAVRAWLDEVAERVHAVRGSYVRLMADDDLEQVLLAAWRREGVVR
jgi:uncharacterized protein (DUF58 family)